MEAFFNAIRPLFGGRMTAKQVEGVEAVLTAIKGLPLFYQAYLLATAFHETNQTMMPITEIGKRSYFNKYEPTTAKGRELGNLRSGDGYLYRGRGYVQITGRNNYSRAGAMLGFNLVANPDLALRETIAAKIMVRGSVDGWFTGKRLTDYLDRPTPDYVGARRIINGTDKAALIAAYAGTFEKALDTVPRGQR